MSGEPLKPGDVCEVIAGCCDAYRTRCLGHEVEIVAVDTRPIVCTACGHRAAEHCRVRPLTAPGYADSFGLIPPQWLRKKPPKADDQGEPRDENVPCEPDFAADLRRQLNREKVTS